MVLKPKSLSELHQPISRIFMKLIVFILVLSLYYYCSQTFYLTFIKDYDVTQSIFAIIPLDTKHGGHWSVGQPTRMDVPNNLEDITTIFTLFTTPDSTFKGEQIVTLLDHVKLTDFGELALLNS